MKSCMYMYIVQSFWLFFKGDAEKILTNKVRCHSWEKKNTIINFYIENACLNVLGKLKIKQLKDKCVFSGCFQQQSAFRKPDHKFGSWMESTNRSQYSIVRFLQFAIEKKNLTILLNFRSLSLSHIIDFCYEGEELLAANHWNSVTDRVKPVLRLASENDFFLDYF